MEAEIEVVETAYEFMLAYAAQGRDDDVDGPGRKSRAVIEELDAAAHSVGAGKSLGKIGIHGHDRNQVH